MIPRGARGARGQCRPDNPGEARAHPPPDRPSAWSRAALPPSDPWPGWGLQPQPCPGSGAAALSAAGPAHCTSGSGLKWETGEPLARKREEEGFVTWKEKERTD